MRSVWLWSYKEKEVADLKTEFLGAVPWKIEGMVEEEGLELYLVVKAKGKGRKCQLHAHLCDFMGEERKQGHQKQVHLHDFTEVRVVKAVKFIRLNTWLIHGSMSDPECRVINHLHPLGSSASNASKGLMDVNNKWLLKFLLSLLFSTVSLNSVVFGLQSKWTVIEI